MIFSRRFRWILASSIPVLALLLFAGWIGWRYLDTKTAACECEDPVDGPRFALYNPFRNRTPERLAESVMAALPTMNCENVPEPRAQCERGKDFKQLSRKLTGREDYEAGSTIRFWEVMQEQKSGGRFGHPIWINLQRSGNSWKIYSVDTYY